jgi:phage tail sheath gpL-like
MAYHDRPDPPWIRAAQIGAYSAASLRVDPGLPLQYIGTNLLTPPLDHHRPRQGEQHCQQRDARSADSQLIAQYGHAQEQ